MSRLIAALMRLRLDHWAWIHAKMSLFLWACFFFASTPPQTVDALGITLNRVAACFAIVGAIMSVVGLIISTNPCLQMRHKGYTIELTGLIIAVCGPLTTMVAHISRIDDDPTSIPRAGFSYTLAAFMLARALVVQRALVKNR